jgi:hypothetical protein
MQPTLARRLDCFVVTHPHIAALALLSLIEVMAAVGRIAKSPSLQHDAQVFVVDLASDALQSP